MDERNIETWYSVPDGKAELKPRGFSMSEASYGSDRWSVGSRYMMAVRSGPEDIPDHILVKHKNFPKDDYASPYTLYYYDITAPNPVLLENDVSRDIRKLKRHQKA